MMRYFLLLFIFVTAAIQVKAQRLLPDITVKNINGKIVVSWRNEYTLPVSYINIQRSYDSLRNYTTIGSVLNPQNKENGYADAAPPYNKMYYRLFIAFEGGAYIITKPERPVKDVPVATVKTADGRDSVIVPVERFPWQVNPLLDSSIQMPPAQNGSTPIKPLITYPSRRIFTSRDNSVVIHLPDATTKKYVVKFFDEHEQLIFELNKLNEEYLILEKVNFVRSGWYHFEIYDGNGIVEKNRFFVPKDPRKQP